MFTETTPCLSSWTSWGDCTGTDRCDPGVKHRQRNCPANCDCGSDPNYEEINCPVPDDCSTTTPICKDNEMPPATCEEMCDSCEGYVNNATCKIDGECEIGRTCVCAAGYKMENGECVIQEECPCYDNGIPYKINQSMPTDQKCMECKCNMDRQKECTDIPNCCDWNTWEAWSPCDPQCGAPGTSTRTRTAKNPDVCNGEDHEETKPCEEKPCNCEVDGNTIPSGTTQVGECYNITCENGNTSISEVPPGNKTYSEWRNDDKDCGDKFCRDVLKRRYRDCTNGTCGGEVCDHETEEETIPCGEDECCEIVWSSWGDCSVPCLNPGDPIGTRHRTYTFVNINDTNCPVEGETEEECGITCVCDKFQWSEWETCENECGHVTVTRTRDFQGNNCSDSTEEERDCYSHDCECEDEDMIFSNHSECEKTCDVMTPPPTCMDVISSDCICGPDMYRDGDSCVTKPNCTVCRYNGQIYEDGEEFTDPNDNCTIYKCVNRQIVEQPKNCDAIPCKDGEYAVPTPDSCCPYECKKSTCEPALEEVEISVDDCTGSYKINASSCQGGCGPSKAYFDFANSNEMVKDCKCCLPGETVNDPQTVPCDPGSVTAERKIVIKKIVSCNCDMCS